jgi:hypothetical protein
MRNAPGKPSTLKKTLKAIEQDASVNNVAKANRECENGNVLRTNELLLACPENLLGWK